MGVFTGHCKGDHGMLLSPHQWASKVFWIWKNTILVYVLVWSQFMHLLSPGFSMTYFNYFSSERLYYTSQVKNLYQTKHVHKIKVYL